ncbi:MAG: 7-cyano-7-deazaguanine tRNA-ribosyltransferase [Candidatus Bathyarchaeota archaeon B23]|nr:MAG: 7-cyano-7-deazaguanine tRNA-ribosyltransferase [Candidatus Bathyarchaeota archaeon B23]
MSFEVVERDLLGRIGRLRTRRGVVETPLFLPVVNPLSQPIPPRRMLEEFGCEALITNAYIIKRRLGDQPELEVHRLLEYDGVVATDSGGYQILVYGDLEADPLEMVEFQRRIGSDIAVILDVPTGWETSRERAEWTVRETLRRAEDALPLIADSEALWMGPVQGGNHLDLVERSARSMSQLPYDIYALGSPTKVMEQYLFPTLVEMVMTAKLNLPPSKPLHLFGAGHPMMFALAVAMGCDLFDSAAYALYAREGRYLTPRGTLKLQELRHLPCPCPICRRYEAEELREMLKFERVRLLAEHNLHVCMAEVETVKQAISEGGLWELLEARSRGHPALASAFRRLAGYGEALERWSPTHKMRGLFYFDHHDLSRPELVRHRRRMDQNYRPPQGASTLLLAPAPRERPYIRSRGYRRLGEGLEGFQGLHLCFYAPPLGVVPPELSETYPLSQIEVSEPLDLETLRWTAEEVAGYVGGKPYEAVILYRGEGVLDEMVERRCREVCEGSGRRFWALSAPNPYGEASLRRLREFLEDRFKENKS